MRRIEFDAADLRLPAWPRGSFVRALLAAVPQGWVRPLAVARQRRAARRAWEAEARRLAWWRSR